MLWLYWRRVELHIDVARKQPVNGEERQRHGPFRQHECVLVFVVDRLDGMKRETDSAKASAWLHRVFWILEDRVLGNPVR